MSAAFIQRCIRASESCAAACERALAADDSYTSPGTDRYSEVHLALVSCASVCTLVARALRSGEADVELLRWCVQIGLQCAGTPCPEDMPEAEWSLAVHACCKCARECDALAEWVSRSAQQVIGSSIDTDFQALSEH